MKVCGMTDIGRHRKDNQDSYAIHQWEDGTALLVVCDGMGGAQAGSVASSVAAEAFFKMQSVTQSGCMKF